MSAMHHYLYDKTSFILSITDGFSMLLVQMTVWRQSVLKVMSSGILAHSGAFGWHNIFIWKSLKSNAFILLDQDIIN